MILRAGRRNNKRIFFEMGQTRIYPRRKMKSLHVARQTKFYDKSLKICNFLVKTYSQSPLTYVVAGWCTESFVRLCVLYAHVTLLNMFNYCFHHDHELLLLFSPVILRVVS